MNVRTVGAVWAGGRCRFRVWAPYADRVELHIVSPEDRFFDMERRERGYHQVGMDSVHPGTRYRYRLNGQRELSDPASTFQPDGVHGPSEVSSADFPWTDASWRGIPIESFVIYELHTGTFTRNGTFDAIIQHLDGLQELGITAIEIMPVAQFPG